MDMISIRSMLFTEIHQSITVVRQCRSFNSQRYDLLLKSDFTWSFRLREMTLTCRMTWNSRWRHHIFHKLCARFCVILIMPVMHVNDSCNFPCIDSLALGHWHMFWDLPGNDAHTSLWYHDTSNHQILSNIFIEGKQSPFFSGIV